MQVNDPVQSIATNPLFGKKKLKVKNITGDSMIIIDSSDKEYSVLVNSFKKIK